MNENEYTDIADDLRQDRVEVGSPSAEFRAQLHQRLSRKIPSPRATRWTTIATAMAAMVIVLIGVWAYFGFVRSGNQLATEPTLQPIVESDRRYDGWELGVAFDYSDEVPLISLDIDNDGNFAVLANRPIGWYEEPVMQQNEFALIIFVDHLFVFPPSTQHPLAGLAQTLQQNDHLTAIEPPQEVQIGDVAATTMLVEAQRDGQRVAEYYVVANVGQRLVYVRGFSAMDEIEAMRQHVERVIASMEAVSYVGWHNVNIGNISISAAMPAEWDVNINYAAFNEENSFDFLPPDQQPLQVYAAAGRVEQPTEAYLRQYADENGFDLVQEPTEISAEPAVFAIAKANNGLRLLGARKIDTQQVFVVQWEIAEADLATLQPIFERVVRAVRSRLVSSVIPDEPETMLADRNLTEKRFMLVGAEARDGTIIYPDDIEGLPEVTFTNERFGERYGLIGSTACQSVTGTYQNPIENLLWVTVTQTPSADCSATDSLFINALNNNHHYQFSQHFLTLIADDGTLLVLSRFAPESAPPYDKAEYMALMPLFLAHYRNRITPETISPPVHVAVDPTFPDGVKRHINGLAVWVFDSADAAQQAIATANIGDIGGTLWQRDRFIAQSTGATNVQHLQLLENWFGQPALVASDGSIPFIDQNLVAHNWWWVNGLSADGEPLVPVDLERNEQTRIKFFSRPLRHNLMLEITDRCETMVGEYVIDEGMTIVEEAARDDLPCSDAFGLPLPNLQVQNGEYALVDNWLFLPNEDGEWLVFSRTKGEDRLAYPSIAAVEAGLTALRDYLGETAVAEVEPAPMKGYELYSWLQDDEWRFALMPGTNLLKTGAVIQNWESQSLSELQVTLAGLPSDADIIWHGGDWFQEDPRGELGWMMMPPGAVIREVLRVRAGIVLSSADYTNMQLHTVQNGETGYDIALAYGVSWYDLSLLNEIEDDTLLSEGDFLLIPPPVAQAQLAVIPNSYSSNGDYLAIGGVYYTHLPAGRYTITYRLFNANGNLIADTGGGETYSSLATRGFAGGASSLIDIRNWQDSFDEDDQLRLETEWRDGDELINSDSTTFRLIDLANRDENNIWLTSVDFVTTEMAWLWQLGDDQVVPNAISLGLEATAQQQYEVIHLRVTATNDSQQIVVEKALREMWEDDIPSETQLIDWMGGVQIPAWELGLTPRTWSGQVDLEITMIGIDDDGAETVLDSLTIDKLTDPLAAP